MKNNIVEQFQIEMAKPGRSQSELAKRLGVDQSAVSRMTKGQRKIRAEELPIINAYLVQMGSEPIGPVSRPTVPDHLAEFPELKPLQAPPSEGVVDRLIANIDAENDAGLIITLSVILEHAIAEQQGSIARVRGEQGGEALERARALFALRNATMHSWQEVSLADPRVRKVAERFVSGIGLGRPEEDTLNQLRERMVLAAAQTVQEINAPGTKPTRTTLKALAEAAFKQKPSDGIL